MVLLLVHIGHVNQGIVEVVELERQGVEPDRTFLEQKDEKRIEAGDQPVEADFRLASFQQQGGF